MGMTAGSVTVNDDGTYSASGMAKAIMDAYVPLVLARYTSPSAATTLGVVQFGADLSNALGSALVAYLQANAKAHVTTQQLGRVPTSIVAGQPIDAPASVVDVPIT